jgi:hypothetical protein
MPFSKMLNKYNKRLSEKKFQLKSIYNVKSILTFSLKKLNKKKSD